MSPTPPRHVVHVITGLGLGGAEMMLYKVLAQRDPARYTTEVIALSDAADLRPRIEALGVTVTMLGLSGAAGTPGAVMRLRRLFRQRRPGVVQTWMYHADLLGGLAARSAGVPVVWDIQGSNLDPGSTRRLTRAIAGWCARLSSRVPARIIACGHSTARTHVALGYDERRIVVIPNAVDTTAFRPDDAARVSVREELRLPADAFLVGMGARLDPQKDHQTLFEAWGRVEATAGRDAHLVLFGKDLLPGHPQVQAWMTAAGASRVHLLGPRSDVARLFAACDVACLSSAYGEGLPNVVAEAMSCAVPCVVTDVGDSAWVVGETGEVVPPRSPDRFAGALRHFYRLGAPGRRAAGLAARRRIEDHFDVRVAAAEYYRVYDAVAGA